MNRKRSGFTIIEVAIVIAIIAVLAALLLPAISGARRAARNVQCQNNLKQLGLAIQSQLQRDGQFPASGYWDVDPANPLGLNPNTEDDLDLLSPTSGDKGWAFKTITPFYSARTPQVPEAGNLRFGMMYSWCLLSLPFIDRSDIYETWDFTPESGSKGSYLDCSNNTANPSFPLDNPTTLENGNYALGRNTTIAAFICPEDITARTPQRGHLSYVVNGGFNTHWLLWRANAQEFIWNPKTQSNLADPMNLSLYIRRENLFRMGLMFLDTTSRRTSAKRRHSVDTVKDGLSTTIMLSENSNAGFKENGEPITNFESNWACPHPYNTSFMANGKAVGLWSSNFGGPYAHFFDQSNNRGAKAPCWASIDTFENHEGGINGDLSTNQEGGFPYPNSYHSGGVNVTMCDGAVRFISDKIEGKTWARLITPDGGRLEYPFSANGQKVRDLVFEGSPNAVTQLPIEENSY